MNPQDTIENERAILDPDGAINMLPEKESIHTFRQAGLVLIGADWERRKIIDAIHKYKPELSGPAATAMHHGMVLEDDSGFLFIETRETGV